jgi:hypothetical protein
MPKPVRYCRGIGCGRPLHPAMRADARFCSEACRSRRRRRFAELDRIADRGTRHCEHCGQALWAHQRADVRYCKPACRQAAYRQRRRPDESAESIGDSLVRSPVLA